VTHSKSAYIIQRRKRQGACQLVGMTTQPKCTDDHSRGLEQCTGAHVQWVLARHEGGAPAKLSLVAVIPRGVGVGDRGEADGAVGFQVRLAEEERLLQVEEVRVDPVGWRQFQKVRKDSSKARAGWW
jgi:hypothetical protein